MSKISKIQQVKASLNSLFVEREEQINALLLGVLSKEHVFLYGPPGTAKSMLVESFARAIGLKYFRWLLTKFTTPEEIFGPYSIKALEQGKYERIITNKLPDSEIAFLDEIFKASSAILNALLTIMEERLFFNDGNPIITPIISIVGASNEIPTSDASLQALYDRFLIKVPVNYISNIDSFQQLWQSPPQAITSPILTKQDIEADIQACQQVTIPQDIVEILLKIKLDLEQEGIKLSDRRWIKAPKILKASAYMRGDSEVKNEDLLNLYMIAWRTTEEISKVKGIILEIAMPDLAKLVELEDAYKSIRDAANEVIKKYKEDPDEADLKSTNEQLMDFISQIKPIASELKKLTPCTQRDQLINEVQAFAKQLQQMAISMLGIDI